MSFKSQLIGFRRVFYQMSYSDEYTYYYLTNIFIFVNASLIWLGKTCGKDSSIISWMLINTTTITNAIWLWYSYNRSGSMPHILHGNGSFRPVVSPPSRFALHYVSRFALLPRVVSPTTWCRFAHFLNLYFIEDIVKNLQFLFPSMMILLYFFKNDRSFISSSKWYIYVIWITVNSRLQSIVYR